MEAIIKRDFSIFECHASKTLASTRAMDSEIRSNMEVVETPHNKNVIRATTRWIMEKMDTHSQAFPAG